MLALDPEGPIGVRNSPSDGFERHVANGLELTYTRHSARACYPRQKLSGGRRQAAGTATIATEVTGARHSGSGSATLSGVMVHEPGSPVTSTPGGTSQPIETTAPIRTWPSGTVVAATCWAIFSPNPGNSNWLDEGVHLRLIP